MSSHTEQYMTEVLCIRLTFIQTVYATTCNVMLFCWSILMPVIGAFGWILSRIGVSLNRCIPILHVFVLLVSQYSPTSNMYFKVMFLYNAENIFPYLQNEVQRVSKVCLAFCL